MTGSLKYDAAIAAMRRPGTRLVQMHGAAAGYYVTGGGGGRVDDATADRIKKHPLVRGKHDALFPNMSQTWAMLNDGPEGAR
jgi:hypothetical protein